jgi:hypothetical protein
VCRTTAAAAAADTRQELRQQLNQGFDLHTTPLMLACKHGQAEAARTLLQHGADPQLVDRRGNNTCLHIAAFAGHASVINVRSYWLAQCSSIAVLKGQQQQCGPEPRLFDRQGPNTCCIMQPCRTHAGVSNGSSLRIEAKPAAAAAPVQAITCAAHWIDMMSLCCCYRCCCR